MPQINEFIGFLHQKRILDRKSQTSEAISNLAKKNACCNKGSQHPQYTQGPLYEESQLEYHDLVELKENVAYGPIM